MHGWLCLAPDTGPHPEAPAKRASKDGGLRLPPPLAGEGDLVGVLMGGDRCARKPETADDQDEDEAAKRVGENAAAPGLLPARPRQAPAHCARDLYVDAFSHG